MTEASPSPAAHAASPWPRRLLWTGGTLAVLLAGSWAAVPQLIQHYAGQWAQGIGRQLTFGEVVFEPWALRLSLRDIRLADRDGSPLLLAKGLRVDADALPLLLGRVSLAELALDAPQLLASRDAAGQWNWARFAADAAGPAKAGPQDSEPVTLLIARLAIQQGRIQLQDALAGGLQRQVLPLDLQLKDLSTLPGSDGRYRLAAALDDGTRLDWQGSLQLQPLQSDGVLKVRDLTLAAVWPYVQPHLTLAAPAGKLGLSVPYHVDLKGKTLQLGSQGFAANLQGLALQAPSSNSALKLASLTLGGGQFDLASRRLAIRQLTLSGAELATVLDRYGRADWLAALPPAAPASAAAKPAVKPAVKPAAGPGWQLQLPAITLQNWQLKATDQRFVSPLSASLTLQRLQASLAMGADGSVKLDKATLALRDLALASGRQPPQARLAALDVAASSADLAKHQLVVGDIQLRGLQLAAARDKQGELDWQRLLRRHPQPAAVAATGSADKAPAPVWQLRYPQLTLSDSQLRWRDATTAQPVVLQLAIDQASLQGNPQQGFALGWQSRLGRGQLALQAQLAANLQDVTATLDARNLPLQGVAPYALDATTLRFGGGELSAKLKGSWINRRWQADGQLALARFALYEPGQREPLLGWQRLQLGNIRARPQRVSVGDVRLLSPQLRFILDEQRVPNFTHVLKPQAATAPVAANPAANPAALPVVDVRAVRVRDAQLDFADRGLNPAFGTRIHSLSGSVLGLSSQPGRRGTVALDGRVDQYGDVRIRGSLSPLDVTRDLDMALNFRNIPLGSLNPYAMTFAGWKITDGRLGTELRYLLQDRQLKGDNRMVVDNIQLGEEVVDYQGTRLPLRLAVAILEDSDGRIDLSLPVAGSLDAPDFSYGHLVWQALRNVLVKVATAPFRALFGGEGFDEIYADAGDDRIPPPEREKLHKLAELLAKRPKLKLALGGGYDAAGDAGALARQHVDSDILQRAAYKLHADEPLPVPDLGDPAVRSAVGDAYSVQFGRLAWLKRVASTADTPARAQAMRAELLAARKVDDKALQALAGARAAAARQLMLAAQPTLAERIALLPPEQVKSAADGVPLLLKLQ
ncbi:DUF748 domain-containing protein [Vogesella sp. DC21W]|uniref:DUF748 domain-containing protein n=1 Tax=Vogesella aquatica TaxID=2984206 RepID=A0ABT5IWJ1_9NEIS|nr:DUF748 domain-containing protein [Vogesella aquatica]MDC7716553.1 DUF748 domain-containing protein [Vogesella aquatica]